MEERYAKIERENRLLLEKMSSIMQGGHGIDNRRKRKIKVGSMNKTFRKMELQRITQENQAILRRIQACQPSYNHLRWQQERKQHILNLKNICEYPVQPVSLESPGAAAGGWRTTTQKMGTMMTWARQSHCQG